MLDIKSQPTLYKILSFDGLEVERFTKKRAWKPWGDYFNSVGTPRILLL